MNSLIELQKQIEIDFLKEHSYEQINDMFRELKAKLDTAENKVKELQEVVSKNDLLQNVSGSLTYEVYVIYDTISGEAYCAFTDKQEGEREAKESGCGIQTIKLYSNNR